MGNNKTKIVFADVHGSRILLRQQTFDSRVFVLFAPEWVEMQEGDQDIMLANINAAIKELGIKDGKYRGGEQPTLELKFPCPKCGHVNTILFKEFLTEVLMCQQCKTRYGSGSQYA